MRAKLQAVPNAIMTQVHLEYMSKRFMHMSFMQVKDIRVTIMTLPRVIPWMEAILTPLQEHLIVKSEVIYNIIERKLDIFFTWVKS